jgi:hypothetical protein
MERIIYSQGKGMVPFILEHDIRAIGPSQFSYIRKDKLFYIAAEEVYWNYATVADEDGAFWLNQTSTK